MAQYIMSLDQGTTGSRCIIFSLDGALKAAQSMEYPLFYPRPGWVEQDPYDILTSQLSVAKKAVETAEIEWSEIAALGITNQRETTILWDRKTGKPVSNAIVWQCRRTAEDCAKLKENGLEATIRQKTGLLCDPYFSATKIKWLLDNIEGLRQRAQRGEILFGTVDTWLIWNLSGGKIHATDYTNASRTMLFNIHTLSWDEELLRLFDIPPEILPTVQPSCSFFGMTDASVLGAALPISGVAGDQQAALFGQCCFEEGELKNTYGTGGFLLMNTGTSPVNASGGLLTTVACDVEGKVHYALEGSIFICGAVIQWIRDGLGLISSASESEEVAKVAPDNGGVYLVPAFVGLGAPYWDPYARGAIFGLTRSSNKHHIVRAAIESMAYQTYEVISAMESACGIKISSLKVDGGAAKNDLLLQFQSDILDIEVVRPYCFETTALGAAYLAGLATGLYKNTEEIRMLAQKSNIFRSNMSDVDRKKLIAGWHNAVHRTLNYDIYEKTD
ncbi:MAG: glycerol kinase GlpK [Clostridiales bacterium]|nr:glycerol kinase GlpK [Clostridiales bacterium]